MPLLSMPNELLCMVTDYLDPRDHSAFTLVSRHFAAVLQHRLRSRLRTLPLKEKKYALLALHWCIVSNDHGQLKFLLENATGIVVVGAKEHQGRRPRYYPPTFTSPRTCDGENWDWIRACGLQLRVWERGLKSVTAAQYAILTRHYVLLRLALSKETCRENAMSTLRYAASHGRLETFEIVLSSFRAIFGKAAWELAQQESLETAIRSRGIRFFIQDGENISSRDSAGRTLLHRAVVGLMSPPDEPVGTVSHPEVVRALLLRGVNTNAHDKTGMTALHIAAAATFKDVVELLLQGGASVDPLDNEGCSPLHLALRAEQRPDKWAAVAVLQEYGADFDIADGNGVIARDLFDGPRELRSLARRRAA